MVEIVEVAPRDGLQNESVLFSVAQKAALIDHAVAAGARRIEVASFVRADRVPQMADTEAVIAVLDLPANVVTIGLVLNKKGAFRALATTVQEVGTVAVASDTFAQRNQGQTSQESADMAAEVIQFVRSEGRRAQATIGAAFGCPFEGAVPHDRVVALAERIAAAGPTEIALADTIGVAVPEDVGTLIERVRAATGLPVRIHLHNTRGTGIANAWAAVQAGVSTIDASLGGIGGCPFAPAATGNIATEDLIYLLDRSGIEHGYDLGKTIDAARWLTHEMGRPLPGAVSRAGGFPTGTAA
ncbi:hydroxymethylglutaryl-CoA lyase [Sphingomonas vulcanisoli]|uniref:Hydroxymethylglutaryl-CoA lyase n=1 Tax=Sphingomonas vulcanisoli TaxID=1658060 RepID=A0ABX0TY54_9SPHN|nr:hydroxymethylglutaryl-CoA lyase [Sphingomonas vulcanisoli]NIJ08561.1 hydroxymethylglutaryl-CoA lyase [Sphingomonas vulcanisoli]